MQTTSPLLSSNLKFHLLDKESTSILDEYLCKYIKNIPRSARYKIVNKFEYNAQSFIKAYEKNFLDDADAAFAVDVKEYRVMTKLYLLMVAYIRALVSKSISKENFETRCGLLSEVLPMEKEEIGKYMDYAPFNFHLFECLNEIIFSKAGLKDWKRDILTNYSGYSDKYEKLTYDEIAKTGKVTTHAVREARAEIERNISDVIKKFTILAPYYSYRSECMLNADLIKVSKRMAKCICGHERAEGITPLFIGTVFSIIYDYKLMPVGSKGEQEYYLVKKEIAEDNNISHIMTNLGRESAD